MRKQFREKSINDVERNTVHKTRTQDGEGGQEAETEKKKQRLIDQHTHITSALARCAVVSLRSRVNDQMSGPRPCMDV